MAAVRRTSLLALLALLAIAAPASAAPVPLDLSLLGRTAAGGEATAEIAAFHPGTERVFVTDAENNQLDVFDFSDPGAPVALAPIDLSAYGGGPNSVTYVPRFGVLAVAVEATDPTLDPTERGSVEIFRAGGTHLRSYPAGFLPDMITTTKRGGKLLVANEGEPVADENDLDADGDDEELLVDPPGSVTIIDIRKGLNHPKIKTAGFQGVPLQGPVRVFLPGATVAQDLEPEYIALKRGKAWVSVQEANAIGVLDIAAGKFKVVRSLGFKDHGLAANPFDASDRDGPGNDPKINIATHPNVYGMYQPDALAAYTLPCKKHGKHSKHKPCKRTLVATANEGDARDWPFFAEEARGGDLTLAVPPFAPGDNTNNDILQRLTVTTTLGNEDADPEYEALYAFGGRSMSLLDEDAKLVYDTGDDLEQLSASLDPANFNKDNAASTIDNRSDNKGPEPEALDVGVVGGRTYAFLGAERSGMIYAFDLSSTPGQAEFAGWINTRETDLGPEGLEFVPSAKSPTGEPMILVTYEISGTVAAYEVGPAS